MLDWNDLRYFLAVAREGSTLAAGRALRVSQTTVARRISSLEDALGIRLFEKRPAGYALTAEGEGLLPRAEAVEASATGFTDAAAAEVRQIRGTVRLSTEEIFSVTLLAPMLRELRDLHPEITIDLEASVEVRDLASGEVDVALRSISTEPAAGVVGRRLCEDNWAFYCSSDYAERNGVPKTIRELKRHTLIGGGGGNLWRAYSAFLDKIGATGSGRHAPGVFDRLAYGSSRRFGHCGAALPGSGGRSGPHPLPASKSRAQEVHVGADA